MIRPYLEIIASLGEGEVGKAEPAEDESAKTIRGWLRRASRSMGTEVVVWETEGAVFFRPKGKKDESEERRESRRHSRSERSPSSGRRRPRR